MRLFSRFCEDQEIMPVYLDCNATTPIEPRVKDKVIYYLSEEFGNAGSRTHEFGVRAKRAIQRAREQVAEVVRCMPEEVVFTSGATESNNLAILGLARYGVESKKRHFISTQIEHKAVLEPLENLVDQGFDVTFVSPNADGAIDPAKIRGALRDDTLLVSVMHVNNETGIRQPISEIAGLLASHSAYFHVDAAQGFGKEIDELQNSRIDLISISGHKIYAPKGVGALVTRRRGLERVPLSPLIFGGGQERGLRPGTLPVHLIAGLGLAAEIAINERDARTKTNSSFREKLLEAFAQFSPVFNGDPELMIPNTVNLSFPGIDSEALMIALKSEIAVSNGSACTSQSYAPSHVLTAMGVDPDIIRGAIRISWCHLSQTPDWSTVAAKIERMQ